VTQHLTREQIYDLLIARETDERLEHLKTCSACAAEVSELQIAISSFADAARMRMPRVAWALVAAALLLFFVWGAVYKRRSVPPTEALNVDGDEILMQQIDAEVSRRTPAAMDPLVQAISASAAHSTNRFPTSRSGSQGQGEAK
jgi:hypothetical protein